MKSVKLIIILVFSLLCGNNFVNAQQHDSDGNENTTTKSVSTSSKSKAKVKAKKNHSIVNTAETAKLHSKSEKEARALTAQKTKSSGKGNIPPEQAKKERAARIAAIIEANKTKKKTPSKRNNN